MPPVLHGDLAIMATPYSNTAKDTDNLTIAGVTSKEMPSSPGEYSIRNIPKDVLNRVISRFRVVAHNDPESGPLGPNKWSIEMVHLNGCSRVKIEPPCPNTANNYSWCNYNIG